MPHSSPLGTGHPPPSYRRYTSEPLDFFTIDRGLRPKCIAHKHPCPKYYTLMHMRIAYSVSTPYTTILQPPLSKGPATR